MVNEVLSNLIIVDGSGKGKITGKNGEKLFLLWHWSPQHIQHGQKINYKKIFSGSIAQIDLIGKEWAGLVMSHKPQTTLKQARACAGNWRMGDQLCIYYIGKQRLHYANKTWLAQVPLHYRLGHRHSVTHLVSLSLAGTPARARTHTVRPSGACQLQDTSRRFEY